MNVSGSCVKIRRMWDGIGCSMLGVVAAVLAFSNHAVADTRSLPSWAATAATRSRAAIVHHTALPMAVAGVRGDKARAGELNWKGGGIDPSERLAAAERAESEGRSEEATEGFRSVLSGGASGVPALRASIGLANILLRAGDVATAVRRFQDVMKRAGADASLQYAAGIPLALALVASGEKPEAERILSQMLARFPDHPLAGQADSTLWMIKEH